MKIQYPIFIILMLLSGCRPSYSPSPLKFKTYEHNPVLYPGKAGSWDELFLCASQVIYHENVFYLFYMGCNVAGRMAVGLATSNDGIHFSKFAGNPVLAPDDEGFDAFTVGPGIVLRENSGWVMYYNCSELGTYAPGTTVGRATASQLPGPWKRNDVPVLASGRKGEWDDGFIIPSSVLRLADGSYRMYYSGGREISLWKDFYIGMATSRDGINWKKHNDPATSQHPFAQSDPVFRPGGAGDWDGDYVWMANVTVSSGLFRMYYTGISDNVNAIGYAESKDGIHWNRYPENPVYRGKDDPSMKSMEDAGSIENPSVLFLDTICFMYYDYGSAAMKIGLATAPAR